MAEGSSTAQHGGKCIVLAGNPGTGKSTLLNGICGGVKFRSGFSTATGFTTVMQRAEWKSASNEAFLLCDTPGLDDVETREKAAQEIHAALKEASDLKLVFVVLLDSGRVRPADVATMSVILKALNGDDRASVNNRYGILINQVSEKALRFMESDDDRGDPKFAPGNPGNRIARTSQEKMAILRESLAPDGFHTSEIFYCDKVAEAVDEDDVLIKLQPGTLSFILGLPSIAVKKVDELKVDALKEMAEAHTRAIDALHQQQKEAMDKMMALQKKRDEENEKQRQEDRKRHEDGMKRQEEMMKQQGEMMQQQIRDQEKEFQQQQDHNKEVLKSVQDDNKQNRERMEKQMEMDREKHEQSIRNQQQALKDAQNRHAEVMQNMERQRQTEAERAQEREKAMQEQLSQQQILMTNIANRPPPPPPGPGPICCLQ